MSPPGSATAPSPALPSPRGYAARMAAFYGASFLVVGSNGPYLPVWLDWRGLTPWQISCVLAAPLFGRLVFTPLISIAADRTGATRRILNLLTWGTLAACLAFSFANGFWAILGVATLYAVFWTTVIPLSEVLALAGVRQLGLDYGRMRLWGSITFIVASVGGGAAIAAWGPRAALWVLTGAAVAAVIAAAWLPPLPERPAGEAAAPPPRRTLSLAEAGVLARQPLFLAFLVATSAAQASHAVLYAFGTLHLTRSGLSPAVVGVLWGIGVVFEIALFAVSKRLAGRLGPVGLMLLGAGAALLRWPLMAIDPPLVVLVPLMALHGLTFGATHLGSIHFLGQTIPDARAATALGVAATVVGVVMGLTLLAAGPLYERLAGGAFAAMALPAAVACVAALWIGRRWDGGRLPELEVEAPGAPSERPTPDRSTA